MSFQDFRHRQRWLSFGVVASLPMAVQVGIAIAWGLWMEEATHSLSFGLTAIAIALGALSVVWLIRPVLHLNTIAIAIAQGHWDQIAALDSIKTLGDLPQSLQHMAEQLQASLVALEAQNQDLKRLDRLKDDFLANISYELSTPLQGIVAMTESMLEGATGELLPLQQQNLLAIAHSSHRLANLVNDLLDFVKLRHETLALQLRPAGLREIVDSVTTLCRPSIQDKDLAIVAAIPDNLPAVFADENRLQQILHNLISNAIKFTPQGQITISAQLVNSQAPSQSRTIASQFKTHIAIAIADTGIGIAADRQTYIFEPFMQVEGSPPKHRSGTGLGLAIAQKLIELHGGTITVDSTPGQGSCFTFTLPAVPAACKLQERPLPPPRDLNPTFPTCLSAATSSVYRDEQREHIFIVDDESLDRQVLANYLCLHHYAITQATNGEEALAMIDSGFKPDLILLDAIMPKMTGYEVTQKLRERYPPTDLPIVLLTAQTRVQDLVIGLDMGANDYLIKPIAKEELLARIKVHLSLQRLRAENLRILEAANRTLEQKVVERTAALSQALERLQAAQQELIHAEKMAALGQLIAGIAHEINTPLGAIRASVGNMTVFLERYLPQIPDFFSNFTSSDRDLFLALLNASSTGYLSTREQRQRQREFRRQLEAAGVDRPDILAETLAIMGIRDRLDSFLPACQTPQGQTAIAIASHFVTLQRSVATIGTASDRAAKVVFALKAYTRYDNNGEKVTIDPIESVETVLTLYHNKLKQGIEIVRNYQPVAAIACYPDELNQVWTNLIHNAIQAMHNRGQMIVEIAEQDAGLLVQFSDSGPGIPLEIQPRIFEPFFTTKPPGEGNGLGLDIVRKIVQKHSGKIAFSSQPGCTTFKVWLPYTS
jgi:signal transduction histidine kinase